MASYKKPKSKIDKEIETANLQMALDSFWTCWKEVFGEGHKKKCFEDYLQIREIIQNRGKNKKRLSG
jgi:hypothetical protein